MASAPIWQYVTLTVIFSLGAFLNLLSIGLLIFLEKVKPEAMTLRQEKLSTGSLLVRTLMGIFGAYLSYCLYMWAPGAFTLVFLAVHWASIAVGYIVSIANAGKEKVYTYSQHVFGALYTSGMVIALITYGVKCL